MERSGGVEGVEVWQRSDSEEVKEEMERGDGKCKAVKVDEGEKWGSVRKAV